jgi:putative drug exporter of the RND superfamily
LCLEGLNRPKYRLTIQCFGFRGWLRLPEDPVREEAHRRDAQHGAITGLAATGGVITSAGCVLAATFAVLATLPSTFLNELGFAVAFGVLLDTIIVRSMLVTALNLDIGRWMWWPSTLARKSDQPPAELGQERAAALTPG